MSAELIVAEPVSEVETMTTELLPSAPETMPADSETMPADSETLPAEDIELMSLLYAKSLTSSIENFFFDDTTVAYVHGLASCIYDVVKDVEDVESIKSWIPTAFSPEFAEKLVEETKDQDNLVAIKDTVMKNVILQLFILGAQESGANADPNVLPWDVKKGLSKDTTLNNLFQIQETDTKLPVTISLNGHSATQEFTSEFVAGILMFSLSSQVNFNVTMYEQVLSPNFLLRENNRYQYKEEVSFLYKLELLEEKMFVFADPETLQGFNTGAYWTGDDYKKFYKNFWKVEVENNEATLVEKVF
jgi:hypothetical protein